MKSHLNMEDITDAHYRYAKRVCKNFEIKKVRRISWFVCSKRYIIVSECIWELSKCMSWNIWACKILLDPAKFLSAPGLAW